MKPWKQYLLLNSVAVLAIFCSLFVVPRDTPIRVWVAVSGCALALLNVALCRRINQSKTSLKVIIFTSVLLAVQVAEGGWQQYVAYVTIGVVALTGAIVWIAKKTVRED